MRDIFRRLLKDMKRLTGLNQYLDLQKLPDDKFKDEVTALLDVLCRTTDTFPMIPDGDKDKIIELGMINDPEFIGLNAKIVSKWLNAHKGRYVEQQAKSEKAAATGHILTPDEYAPYLEEWLAQVKNIGNPDILKEPSKADDLRKRFYGKDVPPLGPVRSNTPEELEARQLEIDERLQRRIEELRTKHPTLSMDELNRLL